MALRREQKGGSPPGICIKFAGEVLKPPGLMELAPRVMMQRNASSVKLQSSLLECECTCGSKCAKQRVKGPFPRGVVEMERRQAVIQGLGLCEDS